MNESVGAKFSQTEMLLARDKSLQLIGDIAGRILPGMKESEAISLAQELTKKSGADKSWHPPVIRFGSNTLKTFKEKGDDGFVLRKTDIFSIDLGPVWNNHEGDLGRTYTVGNDPEMKQCVHDLEGIFKRCIDLWKTKQASGAEIYDFAGQEADDLGWILNLDVAGHRLSDFPHHQYSKDSLQSLTTTPAPYRWVLELHLKHPKKNFGGFYEDLLM